jgi:hypothetical protein
MKLLNYGDIFTEDRMYMAYMKYNNLYEVPTNIYIFYTKRNLIYDDYKFMSTIPISYKYRYVGENVSEIKYNPDSRLINYNIANTEVFELSDEEQLNILAEVI